MNIINQLQLFLLLFFPISLVGMEVTFFNVGQGNCTLVTYPEQIPTLVDAGSSKAPIDGSNLNTTIETIIKKIAQASDDKKLFVIVSHADKDHVNKIQAICQKLLKKGFSINFLLGGNPQLYQKEDSKKLINFINKNSETCEKTFVSDIKKNERTQKFKDLLPAYCQILAAQDTANKKSDTNDTSIVVKVADENFSVLLPGDATGTIMDPLTQNNVNSTKVDGFELSHHGASSHNSNTAAQLDAIDPKRIFISSGLFGGSYNHPRFEVIKTAVEYCIRKKLKDATPHMLTYQHGNVIPAFKGNKQQASFNLVAVNDDSFCTAQTSYPIYHTADSGTITYTHEGITVSDQQSTHENRGIGALQGINTPRFDGIRFLFFNDMEIESDYLKTHLQTLPEALEYLDLRNNNIGHTGIEHLITLFKNRSNLLVKLTDNRLVVKQVLTDICNKENIKAITTKKRILITFRKKGLARDTVESLELKAAHGDNSLFQHTQAQDYTQNTSTKSDNATKNRLSASLNNKKMVYELSSDTANLYIESAGSEQEGYSYQWPRITDICLLSDSLQTVAGITTPQRSTLFDFANNNFKDLQGTFRYTNPNKPWKTIGKEFWSLDTPGISYYHERSPFSKNGNLVLTVSNKNKCLNIYSIDELSFDPKQVKLLKTIPETEIKETFKQSVKNIKRVSLIDNDQSVKINFTDKTNGELRYILEQN